MSVAIISNKMADTLSIFFIIPKLLRILISFPGAIITQIFGHYSLALFEVECPYCQMMTALEFTKAKGFFKCLQYTLQYASPNILVF